MGCFGLGAQLEQRPGGGDELEVYWEGEEVGVSGVSVGLACVRPLDIMLSLLGSHRRTLGERIPVFDLGLENWLLGGDGLKVVRTEAGEQGGGLSS